MTPTTTTTMSTTRTTIPACGDGFQSGEQCDDGNTMDGDGCSARCRLEPGFACVDQGAGSLSVCHATTCGDGVREGFETCDDGNLIPYDGCSPTCTIEPACASGTCTPTSGDGIKAPTEDRDDGNLLAGDGCTPTCTIETGYDCPTATQPGTSQSVTFTGDDDAWAFINGHLAIDLGGRHGVLIGSVTLDAATAVLGLVDGGTNTLDFFQAERHTCDSNYTLTLNGFVSNTVSQCSPQ